MLPDFPKSRREIAEILRLRLQMAIQSKSPLLSLGTHVVQHEGTVHSYDVSTKDGNRTLTEGFTQISAPIEVKFDEIPDLVGENLFKKIDVLADEVARQQSQIGFRKLDQIIDEAGAGVDAGGKLTKEIWLEAFEKREINFDPKTKKQDTVVILHPVMFEALREVLPDWQSDASFVKRYNEILTSKYEDWRDRESRRKLVD